MSYSTVIERRKLDRDNNIVIKTVSFICYEDTWTNCLYIEFQKERFPMFEYPIQTPGGFDYCTGDTNQLELHGGCTFYEENASLPSNKVIVTIGCDYRHLGDHAYEASDCGASIIENDGPKLLKSFLDIIKQRSSQPETEVIP